MPKLLLASSADKVLHKLSGLAKIEPKQTKVAFVQNAALPEGNPDEMFWVQNDRRAFEGLGYSLEIVDITKFSSPDELRQKLEEFQLLHVCGGNTLYINYLFHQTGLTEVCRELVNEDKLIYTGTSAGSIIASPDLFVMKDVVREGADPKFFEGIEREDYYGLNLVPFFIIPHVNSEDWIPENIKVVQLIPKYPHPLLFLHDNQAVWAENGKFEIVEV